MGPGAGALPGAGAGGAGGACSAGNAPGGAGGAGKVPGGAAGGGLATGCLCPASHSVSSCGFGGRLSATRVCVLTPSVSCCMMKSLWALFFTMATARRFSKTTARHPFPLAGVKKTHTSISKTWIISRVSISLISRGNGMTLSPRSCTTADPAPSSVPESSPVSWSKMSSCTCCVDFGMLARAGTGTGHELNAVSPYTPPASLRYFMRFRPVKVLGIVW